MAGAFRAAPARRKTKNTGNELGGFPLFAPVRKKNSGNELDDLGRSGVEK